MFERIKRFQARKIHQQFGLDLNQSLSNTREVCDYIEELALLHSRKTTRPARSRSSACSDYRRVSNNRDWSAVINVPGCRGLNAGVLDNPFL